MEAGANLNTRQPEGDTPLILACRNGWLGKYFRICLIMLFKPSSSDYTVCFFKLTKAYKKHTVDYYMKKKICI